NAEARSGCIRQCERRLRERVTILFIAAKSADDDEMRLRRERHARRRDESRGQHESPHANPRSFRYDHSAVTSATSSNRITGMSHRSIWFTTVTPCLLNATSSASVFAVAGV